MCVEVASAMQSIKRLSRRDLRPQFVALGFAAGVTLIRTLPRILPAVERKLYLRRWLRNPVTVRDLLRSEPHVPGVFRMNFRNSSRHDGVPRPAKPSRWPVRFSLPGKRVRQSPMSVVPESYPRLQP